MAMGPPQKSFLLRYAEFDHAQVAVRSKAAEELEHNTIRRAYKRVSRSLTHKGRPILIEEKPLFEHEDSDRLLIQLLQANNADGFNRKKTAWYKADPQTLTQSQLEDLIDWLERHLRWVEAVDAYEQGQGMTDWREGSQSG